MKTIEIEEAVARMFGIRTNLIVPNLHWALFRHELDLLIVRKSGCAVEVEIKISKSDLKKDAEKRHGHIDPRNRIGHLYFAVPMKLLEAAIEHAPQEAGIITVQPATRWNMDTGKYDELSFLQAKIVRPAIKRRDAGKFTQSEIEYIARLGCMRIWGLKAKLIKAMNGAV
jgi:hypothetical protein